MLDDATNGTSTPLPRCMWCSAVLPSNSEVNCPTCGATLIGEGDNQVPGVTAIDAEAIIRAGRDAKPRQRSRLMSWLSGEYPEEDEPAPPGSLEPPSADVRREMLRLELEAEVANLQAEADALIAEAAVEGRGPDASPEDAAAAAQVVEELETVSAELDRVDEEIDEMPATDGDAAPGTSTDSEPKPA